MANISLNVKLNVKSAQTDIQTLEKNIRMLGTELKSLTVNPQVTAQLNALAKVYYQLNESNRTTIALEKEKTAQMKAESAAVQSANRVNAEYNKIQVEYNKVQREKLKTLRQNDIEWTKRIQADNKHTEAMKKLTLQERKAEEQAHRYTVKKKEQSQTIDDNTQKLALNIERMIQLRLQMALFNLPLQAFKKMWDSVNDTLQKTEDRIIAIQRVIDEPIADSTLSNQLYDLAMQYGQTFDNAAEIATNFARTGMSWTDSLEAAKAALLALNVAELDATQASEGLISIMTQFGYKATDLEGIIDKLNKTADNFPVTTEKILTALQRTGSAAVNANVSLDETIGLVTALSKATNRSGANLGTAVNALIQYSSKSSALDIFSSLSDDTANAVDRYRMGIGSILDVWKEVSDVINNADARQKEILQSLADTEDVTNLGQELHDELGDIFEDTQEVFGTANTFRKNYFIALLANMDTVQQAIDTAADSAGYSQKENEKYLDTYSAKLTTLQTHWQKIANDEQGLLGVKKTLVDIADVLLTVSEWTGGARTMFIALGTAIAELWGGKVLSALKGVAATLKGINGEGAASMGWIGIIAVALSVFEGIVRKIDQSIHEARQETIELWKTNKDTAAELKTYYDKLDTLDEKSDEYAEVEDKIVGLLGEKKVVLEGLTKGTDEYREAVKSLTEAELLEYEIQQANALRAARAELEYGPENPQQGGGRLKGTAEEQLAAYEKYVEKRNEYYKKSLTDPAYEKQYLVYNTLVNRYKPLVDAYNDVKESLDEIAAAWDKINGETDKGTSKTSQYANGLEDVKDKYGDIVDAIKEWRDAEKEATEILSKQNALYEAQRKYAEAFAKARRNYIIDALEAYTKSLENENTLEEKQNAIAEKRLALKEAEQALEDARNQRNVRVYNAATGRFELQANEKDVKSAEEKVQQATEAVNESIESLNDWLKNQAMTEIKAAINNGDYSTKTIKNILSKWLAYSEGGSLTTFADGMTSALTKAVSESVAAAYADSSVQSAAASVSSARTAIGDYYTNQFLDNLQKYFDGTSITSAAKVNALIAEYRKLGVSESTFKKVRDIIKAATGIDINKTGGKGGSTEKIPHVTQGGSNVYDKGGVLYGKGGIKATEDNEIVLPPNVARSILNPTSNEQFRSFVDSLGILFGTSKTVASPKPMSNHAISDSHNQSYTINGIPISTADAKRYTVEELFNAMELVKA